MAWPFKKSEEITKEDILSSITVDDVMSQPLLWHECEKKFYESFQTYKLKGAPPAPTLTEQIMQIAPWGLALILLLAVIFKK